VTIFGWDLSHYDLSTIGDAVDEGFSFFTHKAGGDANDTEIAAWWSGVKGISATKALLGAYWVLYPGSASSRADQFLARLDATCPGWRDRPFMLQVDCEKWNNDSSTVPSKADIKTFCDRLVAKMPKLRPIVYGPNWVYGDSLTGLGYPLWASAYSTASSGTASGIYAGIGGDNSSKWGAYSGQTPAILQFTSSATIAGQTTCDANAFRGTLAQLTALVAPGWAESMALTDDDKTWMAANLGPTAVWKTDGIITAPAGSVNSDGSPNLYWSGQTYFANIYGKTVAIRNAQSLVPTVADIVAGVVAALPPASTGGPTLDQIEAAAEAGVDSAFAKAFGPAALDGPRGQHGAVDDGTAPDQ
jgi:hypothetical protein